ncbi:TetR/AcrR family transcriptional regulator [Zavarzinia sp. CC-PAN008]|uniref:TetR/AcrR family transcriptional regulator n=1 Tax=Zavarzinia sp. CC-PAN008 TaxID=3243332 RepID=UPI003F746DE4
METASSRAPREERRQEILDAAFQEFAAKGYAGASMAAIARTARASKETLYAWFGNKEQLFSTLFQARLQGTTRGSAAALAQGQPPDVVLPIIAEETLRFVLAVEPLSRAIVADGPGGAALRMAGGVIDEDRRRFAAIFCLWRDQGHLAFDDDPMEIVSLFVAMAQGEWPTLLALGAVDAITDVMIAAHARRVTRILLNGLAPRQPA